MIVSVTIHDYNRIIVYYNLLYITIIIDEEDNGDGDGDNHNF